MNDFNPNSHDAVFSRILQRMDEQDNTASSTKSEFLHILGEIRDEVKKTNGRVRSLESWRDTTKAKIAGLAAGVSGIVAVIAWVLERLG